MPPKANVIIKYGPYNSHGIVEYKTERLQGLQKYLISRGHKVVELVQEKHWNNVEIIVNEEKIFKCMLTDLEFGGDGELDPIVIKVEELVTKTAPAVGEPSLKRPLKDRLSYPGQGEATSESLNKENLAKPIQQSVNVSSTGTLTKTVFTSQLSSEATKPEESAHKASAETPESLAMAKKIQDENKKKALLLKIEVQKKARELIEQQLKDQKILMSKLEQAKTVEEKTQILNLVKKLNEAIDKEKEILSKKMDDLEIEGESKHPGSFGPAKSHKPSFVIPPVHQLKINNKRLNTTSFLKAGANKLVNKSAPKPVHQLAPASMYTYSRVSVDRRPKQLLFSGVENEEEKSNIINLVKIGSLNIEKIEEKKDENDETQTCVLVDFVTRRDAEIAYSKCTKSLGKVCKNVKITWFKPIESGSKEDETQIEKNDEKNETDDQKEVVNDNGNKLENDDPNDSVINCLADDKVENKSLELKENQVSSDNKFEENADVFDSIFNEKE